LIACVTKAQNTPPELPKPPQPPKNEASLEQNLAATELRNLGKTMTIPFQCTDEDISWAGMSCTEEEPCPVYVDMATLEVLGNRLIVVGNIHGESTTLYSLLLISDDGGAIWREPFERLRGTGLDHLEFIDFQNGWISGATLVPLPRDPFFLITSDGGKTWRQRSLFSEGGGGAIQQFWFESATNGSLVIDRMASADAARYELYESANGGESWTVRRTSEKPIPLKRAASDASAPGWRIRADARTKSYVIEKRQGDRWSATASFLIQIGTCQSVPRASAPPPETEETPAPAPPTAQRPPPKKPKK